MGEEFLNHQELCPIVNLHNQAVIVVPDVEDQQRFVLIGIRVELANVVKIARDGAAGRFVPAHQFLRRVRVKIRVPLNGRRADHVHPLMFA